MAKDEKCSNIADPVKRKKCMKKKKDQVEGGLKITKKRKRKPPID